MSGPLFFYSIERISIVICYHRVYAHSFVQYFAKTILGIKLFVLCAGDIEIQEQGLFLLF